MAKGPTKAELKTIDAAVEVFLRNRGLFESFAQALVTYFINDSVLAKHIHFIKQRVKDPEHLREKLVRKNFQGEAVDASNLFEKITDLAGVRIIHLHSDQMHDIHTALMSILREQKLELLEEPTANCWDVEYEQLFKTFGLQTRSRDAMYTSVHYVVQANQRTRVTCEVQVRTLMDEVWGEVSHRVTDSCAACLSPSWL